MARRPTRIDRIDPDVVAVAVAVAVYDTDVDCDNPRGCGCDDDDLAIQHVSSMQYHCRYTRVVSTLGPPLNGAVLMENTYWSSDSAPSIRNAARTANTGEACLPPAHQHDGSRVGWPADPLSNVHRARATASASAYWAAESAAVPLHSRGCDGA